MSKTSILDYIQQSDNASQFTSGYYQAQVTGIDPTTGQVYLQQIDDEDSQPDEAPYTCLQGFVPKVGDWVWVARSGRTGVVLGVLQRDSLPGYLNLPGGCAIAFGNGSPNGNVTLPVGSIYLRTDVNAPETGHQLFVKVSGSGNTGWLSATKAPRRRSVREILVYEGASTPSSFVSKGFQNGPTITDSSDSNADASTGAFLQLNTSSSINNVASVVAGANSGVRFDWQPDLSLGIRNPATITSIRQWFGLFNGAPSASDDPAVSGIGFRFSTSASDVNWQAWTNDGSGEGTITDTGIAFNDNTGQELRCIVDTGESAVDFYIDGSWVARHTTNLPASTTVLNYGLYVTTLTASARSLRWGRVTLECES